MRKLRGLCRAEANLARALTSFEKAGALYPEVASTLHTMGLVAATMGNHELARQRILRSIEIVRKSRVPTTTTSPTVMPIWRCCITFVGNSSVPSLTTRDALAVRTKLFGTNHLLVAHFASDLGASYLGNGDLPLASSSLQRAHQILEKALGPTNLSVAEVIDRLSQLNEEQGILRGKTALRSGLRDQAPRSGKLQLLHAGESQRSCETVCLLGDPEPALSAADSIQQGKRIWLRISFRLLLNVSG
jgi:hypothetical protein